MNRYHIEGTKIIATWDETRDAFIGGKVKVRKIKRRSVWASCKTKDEAEEMLKQLKERGY